MMTVRRSLISLTMTLLMLVCCSRQPAEAQLLIRAGDSTFIKFGTLVQAMADWQQLINADGTETTGYQQNLFIRRARLLFSGQIVKDVTFLFILDSANIGRNKSPNASFSPGVTILDAFVLWKVAPELQFQGGWFYVPLSRSTLTASASFPSLDAAPVAFLAAVPAGSPAMRDAGFGAQGFFLKNRLHYRAGVYQGARQTGGRNSYRYAGRLQYEFFDTETSTFVYPGTNLGNKKILALGIGTDNQSGYHAYSADVFFDIPIGKGNAVNGSFSWFQYDGQSWFPTLPRQNDFLVEAGFYFGSAKVHPFFQYQSVNHANAADEAKDSRRYQLGLHYYVSGQNLKLSAAYTRLDPLRAGAPSTNQLTIQLQAFYN